MYTRRMEMRTIDAELLLDARAMIGEGPWWDSGRGLLYWLDIKGKNLHIFDPAAGSDRRLELGSMPGTVVGRESGGLLMAMENGFEFFDPETGLGSEILDPESDLAGNRFNDGKCDSRGRLWAGTMDDAEKETTGSLYRLDPDLECRRMIGGVGISNGIAFGADDKTMYYVDTPTRRIDAFDFDVATGSVSNRRTVVEVPKSMGMPDGMTIDDEGLLWVALWGGWGLGRWDPRSGKLAARVRLPVAKTSSCAFGGSGRSGARLDRLYVTTARVGLGPEEMKAQPHAGGLFVLEPGVGGPAPVPFAG